MAVLLILQIVQLRIIINLWCMHNNMFVPLSQVSCLCGIEIIWLTVCVILHIEH